MIALLRAVNVGSWRKVPMAELRALCEEIGLTGVRTYIQSGNVVFSGGARPATVAARLEKAIGERFGFPVDVVVRTAAEWARYTAGSPFPEADAAEPNRVMLLLSRAPVPPGAVAALADRAKDGERVEARDDAVWIHYPNGAGRSKLTPAVIDRLLGSPTTARNLNTVRAIAGLLGETS